MGLIKLAVIGGVAFWAGSRYNEKHEGGCRRKRQMDQYNTQPDAPRDTPNPDPSYYHGHDSWHRSNEKGTVQFNPTYHVQDTKTMPSTDVVVDERSTSAPPVYGYRRSSLKLSEQQQQQQQLQRQQQQQLESPKYQQMVFVEPKAPYALEQPMWK